MKSEKSRRYEYAIMPGLVPGIRIITASPASKAWMAGTSPAMT
jgi:hypothetical protein